MKRGFLNKTYASGSTLSAGASKAVTNGHGASTESPAGAGHAQETIRALRRKLDNWATEGSDRRGAPTTLRKKQPDRETAESELLRRLNAVNGQAVISHFIVDSTTKIFFLAIDQHSKARLAAQILSPLSAVPRINLLTSRPSPYPSGGRVAVAQGAARPGDLLLREFPLICLPNYYFAAAGATQAQTNFEVMIEVMLRAHSPAAEALYRSLHNAWAAPAYAGPFDHRGNGVLTGIYNTNCYFLDGLPSDDKIEYSGVFPAFSRVSHSCCPNAIAKWDSRTMTLSVRAARHINAQEEITVSYVPDLLWSTAQRQDFLRDGYHFECTCAACSEPGVSDARRAEIKGATQPTRCEFVEWVTGTMANRSSADTDILERSKRICELYEREQLIDDSDHLGGWTHAVVVLSCYLALGKEREAAFWARKVQTWMQVTGQDEPPELLATLQDVRSSPMWDLRRKFADAAP